MFTFDATEQINEVSRTTRTRTTTTQVITRYFGHWPQTKMDTSKNGVIERKINLFLMLTKTIKFDNL